VEDYPAGYPRFAALISSHPSFHVARRFTALRARSLLYKQDELSCLEHELAEIDTAETRPLFLGNYRRDRNQARKDVLDRVAVALKEYGMPPTRFSRILSDVYLRRASR